MALEGWGLALRLQSPLELSCASPGSALFLCFFLKWRRRGQVAGKSSDSGSNRSHLLFPPAPLPSFCSKKKLKRRQAPRDVWDCSHNWSFSTLSTLSSPHCFKAEEEQVGRGKMPSPWSPCCSAGGRNGRGGRIFRAQSRETGNGFAAPPALHLGCLPPFTTPSGTPLPLPNDVPVFAPPTLRCSSSAPCSPFPFALCPCLLFPVPQMGGGGSR